MTNASSAANDLDRAKSALQAIDANGGHNEKWKVLAAAKSAGIDCETVRAWWTSAREYDESEFEASWRGTSETGKIGPGTLYAIAQRSGWDPRTAPAAPRQSAAEIAASRKARQHREEERARERAASHKHAAGRAERLWEGLSTTGQSAYLERKKVQAHGARFVLRGGEVEDVVIPMRAESPDIVNVQIITDRGEFAGSKKYLKNGRVSGCRYDIGDFSGDPAVVGVAEGFATAASIYAATRMPVAVAFNSANLKPVALVLRKMFPAARIVVCADDDRHLEGRPGGNVGLKKATEAAEAVGGCVAVPANLAPGESDFNDLHVRSGLAAVADCVEQALNARAKDISAPRAPTPSPPIEAANDSDLAAVAPKTSGDADTDPFFVNKTGVWFRAADKDGRRLPDTRICSQIIVLGRTLLGSREWGYMLRIRTPINAHVEWAMPARLLAAEGGEYRAMLAQLGADVPTSSRTRSLLTIYLQTRPVERVIRCVDTTGWHDRQFVTPARTYGGGDDPIIYQDDGSFSHRLGVQGTVEDWQRAVASYCANNSRLIFSVSIAMASVLLGLSGVEGGTVNFWGSSGCGKTTCLLIAQSVFGGPGYMQRWRATDNALESICTQHNDLLLLLDELGQLQPKVAGEAAYLISNGEGKSRASRAGVARRRMSWRVLVLSCGEIRLADHMAEAGQRTRAGQSVRLVDIPVDAGANLGAFEDLHGAENGSAFAQMLARNAARSYGAVGQRFIEYAVQNVETLPARIRRALDATEGEWLTKAAGGQAHRVARRFALIGLAGELATEAGCTGWESGIANAAAHACFQAYLDSRGGESNSEEGTMLRQVRGWLSANAAGRFTWWHRAHDDRAPRTLNAAGFRRLVDQSGEAIAVRSDDSVLADHRRDDAVSEFYVFTDCFRSEVCAGFDHTAVLRLLHKRGHLKADSKGRFTRQERLPGMDKVQVYRLKSSIFSDSEGDA